MVRRVYVSARGNVFMREIAEHLVEALRLGGDGAELVVDDLPPAGGRPLQHIVVAPHEFFVLNRAAEIDRRRAAAHCVCVNTEQPATPFFDLAMTYAGLGPVVFDINPFALAAVRRRGLNAVHLPLGYVPSIDVWRQIDVRPRTVDIAFMGARTPRREQFLAAAAGQLWEWRTDLRIFSWHRPILAGAGGFVAGSDKYAAFAASRILLNVHRGDEPYFEWARVIDAIANGCVIATETSEGIEPLVAGTHLVQAPIEVLAEQALALAADEPRRARMADAAYEVLTGELHQQTLLAGALAEAERLATRPSRPKPAAPWAGKAAAVRHRALQAGRTLLASRISAPAGEVETLRKSAAELKSAFVAQVQISRGLERSLALVEHGDADYVDVVTTPAWHAAQPDVSVVVPLYDQGHFLEDAVRSVVANTGVATELIVVDDHSTDDSALAAEKLLAELQWLPATLVRRAANGGLSVARNTGFSFARGRAVLPLDADNMLYPNALAVLLERLDASPPEVLATYGILERFDADGSVGLTSHLPWDVDLLVHGAYIDAMALFRLDRWKDLGGYVDPPGIHGWEDYDLWLSAAERGWRAEIVTRIVGRYREHAGSMRRISDVDMASSFVTLRERHPRLPWPS